MPTKKKNKKKHDVSDDDDDLDSKPQKISKKQKLLQKAKSDFDPIIYMLIEIWIFKNILD